MKSCWIVPHGGSALMEFRDIPAPIPAAGEVLIRTRATSLNRGEWMAAKGAGVAAKIGGMDAAGVVEVAGGDCGFQPGDEVCGRVSGGWAECCIARADQLMAKPASLSWGQAAAVGIAWLTAYELTHPPCGKLRVGEILLVAGASSAVGVAAVLLGKAMGATVIGTSGSAGKLERLRELGMDHGILTRLPDFNGHVRGLTDGHGADLAINLIGGSMFAELVRCLGRRGRLGVVGYLDGIFEATLDLAAVHAGRLEIFGVSNARTSTQEKADVTQGFVREVLPLLAGGRLSPEMDSVFRFADAPHAAARMESGDLFGKVVLTFC